MKALLRIPLAKKLASANAFIILVTSVIASFAARGAVRTTGQFVVIVGLTLAASIVLSGMLIILALKPLQDLEVTAARVWHGDLDARVRPSLLADWRIARVGYTLNRLLDRLMADRARTRRLASEIISAGDRERAYIARELHDSVAQTMVGLVMRLSAVTCDCTDPTLAAQLGAIKAIGADTLEEIRMLAHTMHPRVLDDLGLVAALTNLATQASEYGHTSVTAEATPQIDRHDVPPAVASVLYRVAQEAVSNAIRHGQAHTVHLQVAVNDQETTLVVSDDGRGFDVADAERRRLGMGLFTMRERVSLVDGHITINSIPDEGTHVIAQIPFQQRRDVRPLSDDTAKLVVTDEFVHVPTRCLS